MRMIPELRIGERHWLRMLNRGLKLGHKYKFLLGLAVDAQREEWVVVRDGKFDLHLPSKDAGVYFSMLLEGARAHSRDVELIADDLRSGAGGCIVDVGGNIGSWILTCLSLSICR